MKMLIGLVVGGLAAWLYSSERAREQVRRRLVTTMPESLSQLRQTAASAAADGAQRVAEAIDSAPVSDRVKDTASEAAFNVWAAADKLGQADGVAGVAQGEDIRADS